MPVKVDQSLVGIRIIFRRKFSQVAEYQFRYGLEPGKPERVLIHYSSPTPKSYLHETTVLAVSEKGGVIIGTPEGQLVGTRADFFQTERVLDTIRKAGITPETRVVLVSEDDILL